MKRPGHGLWQVLAGHEVFRERNGSPGPSCTQQAQAVMPGSLRGRTGLGAGDWSPAGWSVCPHAAHR